MRDPERNSEHPNLMEVKPFPNFLQGLTIFSIDGFNFLKLKNL